MRIEPLPRDPSVPVAPITPRQRAMLLARLKDLRGTAQMHGTSLSDWELMDEANAARLHFEVGAWGWWSQQRRESLSVQDRARVIFAVLASGKTSVGYEFFTAFEFGERQFDAFFEMGDGHEVVDAVSELVVSSGNAAALACLQANGWRREPAQSSLF
jgi:hypothetical protein